MAHQDLTVAPLIELSGITKSYGPVKSLRGVDLRLARGEVLGVVGDNGAGKSTLMKILAGAV
ncbi:MAG: ATP-binding cassette domain-containing protein, partial [Rhodococcus sp.]|nr:ATP-binding cassette domain-containing protein [Rhodococcus sp. (in: high G+C Gram-positive bacteria)]